MQTIDKHVTIVLSKMVRSILCHIVATPLVDLIIRTSALTFFVVIPIYFAR